MSAGSTGCGLFPMWSTGSRCGCWSRPPAAFSAARSRPDAAFSHRSDEAFAIGGDGELRWRGASVGRLVAGENCWRRGRRSLAGDFLEGEAREKVRRRLQEFLSKARSSAGWRRFLPRSIAAWRFGRGLVYPAGRRAGARPRCWDQVAALARQTGRRCAGWVCGSAPKASISSRCCGADTCAFGRFSGLCGTAAVPTAAAARRMAKPIAVDPALPASFYAAIGRRVVGGSRCGPTGWSGSPPRRGASRPRSVHAGAELAAIAGVDDRLRRVVATLGYRAVIESGKVIFIARPQRQRDPKRIGRRVDRLGTDIPLPS